MFDLRPWGGSNVILTEFWSVETGNFSLGMLVNHILKSGCIWLFRPSTMISSFGIQDMARWQFWRRTHPPLAFASFIMFSALLSYPWPNDIIDVLETISSSSENFLKSATGSEPGLRTKIKGVKQEESLKQALILKVGGSMKSFPIFSTI